MKKALLGALLSGLVFPGVGQMALKQKKRGILLVVSSLLSLIWFFSICTQRALTILEQVQGDTSILDYTAISEAVQKAMTTSDNTAFSISLILIIFIWLISVVDAYRLGKEDGW
ncbi:MAG: hypothetical protein KKB94_06635 [Proteobacteria bacterium]|nr:hypothetical protein [Pseudomonadota bacterium]